MTRKRRTKSSGIAIRSLATSVQRNDISRQSEDADSFGTSYDNIILATPYSISSLSTFVEQSNTLPQCIEAMVTNTTRFGFHVIPISEGVTIDKKEKELLESYIESPNTEESLMSVQSAVVEDYERYGFGFYEVIRNVRRQPSLLKQAKAFNIRLMRRSGSPVSITVDVARGGSRNKVTELKKFRKYIQIIGATKVYFKEFGDPRDMDYRTGKYASKDTPVAKEDKATEILHYRQYSEDSYGLPRWISQLPSILGSRESEEVNLRYFEDNTVPPMILSVSGGRLTRQSFEDLNRLLKAKGVGKDRQNQILLIEAIPETTGLDDKGTTRIQVDKLTSERPSDGLFREYDDSNINKVRSSFRLPPVVIGMSQDINFACYDEKTETLTDKGWIKHHEWSGHKIACFDYKTSSIEYHNPEGKALVYDVVDVNMYKINNSNQDIMVTPKHTMVFSCMHNKVVKKRSIEELYERCRVYLPASGTYVGGAGIEEFEVPHIPYRYDKVEQGNTEVGPIPMDLLMELIGYYVADGCLYYSDSGVPLGVRIGAKKLRKITKFGSLCEELEEYGFNYAINDNKAGNYYVIKHKGMSTWLAENAGEGSRNKRLPDMVWMLESSKLRVLFDSLVFCDGYKDTREGRTSIQYSSTSEMLADDVQRLAILLEYRAAKHINLLGGFNTSKDYIYRVFVSERKFSQVQVAQQVTRVKYSGKVHCFTVPTGAYITRRNGKVAFQGNTAQVSMYVAESQVFMPARKIKDEFINKRFVNHPNGLNLKTVMLESSGPRVTNPDQVVKTFTSVNTMGGITPRSSIAMLNTTLQLSIPTYPERGEDGWEEWMDQPIALALKIAGPAPETGQGERDNEVQSNKDGGVKDTENTGETGMETQAVEHGQE